MHRQQNELTAEQEFLGRVYVFIHSRAEYLRQREAAAGRSRQANDPATADRQQQTTDHSKDTTR